MIFNGLINKVLFALQLVAAQIMFTAYLKKRQRFILRLMCYIAVTLAAAVFFPVPVDNPWYSAMMFTVLFAFTVGLLKICFDERWINILFCGIAAYTTQHFAYMFTNFVVTLLMRDTSPLLGFYGNAIFDITAFDEKTALAAVIWVLCTYVAYTAFWFAFARRIKNNRDLTIRSMSLLFLVGAGLLGDIVLNLLFVYLDTARTLIGSIIIYLYGCFCCVLLLCLQFEIIAARKFENERDFVKRLWYQEKQQYELSKENIDIINLKCHDIKHQIREIGQSKSIPKETVDEIERSVSVYDAAIQTGNEVLDIILTEKSMRCYKNKVLFSCIADGEKISFMNDTDVYSLFGNALDNAMEATMKIADEQKRIIGLTMRRVGRMVTLNIHNSFEGNLMFENGLPKTTKKDEIFHGYGMKSIKMIVEKYDGNLTVAVKDGIFNLDILFPLKQKA